MPGLALRVPAGFVAGHLVRKLKSLEGVEVVPCPRDAFSEPRLIEDFVSSCDAIVHLAGMNRGDQEELYNTNIRLAEQLVAAADSERPLHIVFASSTQRDEDNAYGKSKLAAESLLESWALESPSRRNTNLVIPNVFGPGCRPNYNSVVATFCHQIAQGERPRVLQDKRIEFILDQ